MRRMARPSGPEPGSLERSNILMVSMNITLSVMYALMVVMMHNSRGITPIRATGLPTWRRVTRGQYPTMLAEGTPGVRRCAPAPGSRSEKVEKSRRATTARGCVRRRRFSCFLDDPSSQDNLKQTMVLTEIDPLIVRSNWAWKPTPIDLEWFSLPYGGAQRVYSDVTEI
jgi:hypothetical protein